MGSPAPLIFGIMSHPSNCWPTDLKIMGEVPIHERAMTFGILFLPKRRLNGRKTQSCRSIAINDKVTALSILQKNRLPQEHSKQVQQKPECPKDESLSRLTRAGSAEKRKFHSLQDCRTNSVELCVNLNAFSVNNKRMRLPRNRPNRRLIISLY